MAVLNGVIAAPFLWVVMVIATDATIMGRHRNRRLTLALGWFTLALMAIASVAFFVISYA